MIDEEESLEETFENNTNTPEELTMIEEIEKINTAIADLVERQDEISHNLLASISRRKSNGS